MIVILLISGWLGAHTSGSIERYLFPYLIYDVDKVRSQNIKVTDYHDGKYLLSNGEIVPTDKVSAPDLIGKVVFVIVGGTVLLLGRAILLYLTGKYLPDLYQGLAYFLATKK